MISEIMYDSDCFNVNIVVIFESLQYILGICK